MDGIHQYHEDRQRRERTFRRGLVVVLIAMIVVGAFVCDDSEAMTSHPPLFHVSTTNYCLHGTMADGSYTRERSAASNMHPLGTRIRIVGRPTGHRGMRRYVIRDRIGWGTSLDLWTPSCGTAIAFGRKNVTYKIGWRKRKP